MDKIKRDTKDLKVRSSAAHMPTRAMRDRTKFTRKTKHKKAWS